MKKIGILGGMSPEASIEYYRLFVKLTKEKESYGNFPELIIYNLNFEDFCNPVSKGRHKEVIELLRTKLKAIEDAGADFVLMASNTPHMYYADLKEEISIPLLSIVKATADAASEKGFQKVGLLGTDFTMTSDFYPEELSNHGLKTVIPDEQDRKYVHSKIMNELVAGNFRESTRKKLTELIRKLKEEKNIDGAVLGCTELPLILSEEEVGVPVLDTTRIHVEAALEFASG